MPFDDNNDFDRADSKRWNKLMDREARWDVFYFITEIVKVAAIVFIAVKLAA